MSSLGVRENTFWENSENSFVHEDGLILCKIRKVKTFSCSVRAGRASNLAVVWLWVAFTRHSSLWNVVWVITAKKRTCEHRRTNVSKYVKKKKRNRRLYWGGKMCTSPETDPTVENLSSAFHFESGKFASFRDDWWMHKVAVIYKYSLMTAEFEMTPTV